MNSSAAELSLESVEEEDSAAWGESGHADGEELEAPAEPNAA